MVIIPLTDQDYFPTAQLGSLPGDPSADKCFGFVTIPDDIDEGLENFRVVLEMANNVIMSRTGAITVDPDTDDVIIMIINFTPPTGPEVEGINT